MQHNDDFLAKWEHIVNDVNKTAAWEQKFADCVKQVKDRENRNRKIAPLMTELGNMNRRAGYNIYKG